MTDLTVIGVDPGQTTGIARLRWLDEAARPQVDLLQCSPGMVLWLVTRLLWDHHAVPEPNGTALLAIEKFVVSNRAARSHDAQAGEIARDLIGGLKTLDWPWLRIVARSAAEVKPWATNERLAAAGIEAKGMRHALDAARHALFAAVRDGARPDPLSRKAR